MYHVSILCNYLAILLWKNYGFELQSRQGQYNKSGAPQGGGGQKVLWYWARTSEGPGVHVNNYFNIY